MAAVGDGNGGKVPIHFDRRDYLRIAGVMLGLMTFTLTSGVAVAMYVFQTRADAAAEKAIATAKHVEIELKAALHEQEAKLLREADNKVVLDVKAMSKTQGDNIRTIMREAWIPKKKIAPQPAGVSFDDIDEITQP